MRLFKSFLAAATLLGFAAAANAVPYTWVDDIDFTPDRYITPGSPAGYTHSILDDGFNPLIDLVYDYELRIDLFDDNDDPWYAPLEIAVISQPGVIGDTIYFDLSGTEFGGWSLAGHALLALTGELSVVVASIAGDFFLGGSTLTVWGEELGGTSVPEPATLGLFGLGLLAVGAVARKKKA
ncbi:MAG TPA: PEP-CTERM sorting domain-containing protein [Steroidobacter sp.]|jgi:hypothetical protein|nr:PEP-CTERM sorting domain-containing protein [Steroidobacteraceae bacterium]HLS80118.1 PEP-CTERM sorting domain-containing protein [Steroidobacter sp.]